MELLVALALTGMIVALALGMMARSRNVDRARSMRSALIREGTFASMVMTNTLRRAGLGIPRGAHIDDGARTFDSPLIWGDTDVLGIVADLERPHAQYSTFGYLHDVAPSSNNRRRLAWHTENNGRCLPTSPATCAPEASSVFFPGASNLCDAPSASSLSHRTCPWGLKRLETGDDFIIVSGGGDWTDANFTPSGLVFDSGGTSPNDVLFLELAADYTDVSNSWPNTPGAPPHEVSGLGYVSTPDRLFYRFSGAGPFTLERKQCWGRPDPGSPTATPSAPNPDWPSSTVTSFPSNLESGTPGQFCHPPGDAAWETLLTNIDSFQLRYFDDQGNELTTRPLDPTERVAASRVDYSFTLQRIDAVTGQVVAHDVVGSAAFRNAP